MYLKPSSSLISFCNVQVDFKLSMTSCNFTLIQSHLNLVFRSNKTTCTAFPPPLVTDLSDTTPLYAVSLDA